MSARTWSRTVAVPPEEWWRTQKTDQRPTMREALEAAHSRRDDGRSVCVGGEFKKNDRCQILREAASAVHPSNQHDRRAQKKRKRQRRNVKHKVCLVFCVLLRPFGSTDRKLEGRDSLSYLSSHVLSNLGFGVRNLGFAVAVEASVCQPCPPDLWLIVFPCAEFGLSIIQP